MTTDPTLQTQEEDSLISKKSYAQVDLLVGPPKDRASAKPKRARAHPVKVRLSEEERGAVQANAEEAGCSVNAYLKALALKRWPIGPALRQSLLSIYRELTRQGTNLNQIAKHLNGGTANPAQGESMLVIVGRSLLQAHKAVRNALSQGMPES